MSRKPAFVGMSAADQLLAGTAKVSITPEDGKKPIHDKVYARSLVLDVGGERIAFVAVDLGIYTSETLVAACKERFGISHLVLSSSHTHSDPGRNHAAFYEERITQVVETAVTNMFPARISAGHRSFPQLGFNRLVVQGGRPRPRILVRGRSLHVREPRKNPLRPGRPGGRSHQDRGHATAGRAPS